MTLEHLSVHSHLEASNKRERGMTLNTRNSSVYKASMLYKLSQHQKDRKIRKTTLSMAHT
jgi:hypothetical protein